MSGESTAWRRRAERAEAEVERLRSEVELLRTLERELMTVLPYDDEDVETSLVVSAAQLRVELARQAEQITAVREDVQAALFVAEGIHDDEEGE